jgi:hypothetical protein
LTLEETSTPVCSQPGCPIAEDGRCLDGFPDGKGCPNLADDGRAPPTEPELPEAEFSDVVLGPRSEEPPVEEEFIELGGDQSLSLLEADEVAARWGARVILLAGEYDFGKTTLVSQLYGQFLKGRFHGSTFAGSRCLMALDRRHQSSRGPGGKPKPGHTTDEGMRLLDFQVVTREGLRVTLLLTDIQGEFVRSVIDSAPVSDELPIAARADRVAVLVNGAQVGDPYNRQVAVQRARLLIGSLTEPGGFPSGRPIALVLTKCDLVSDEGLAWFAEKALELEQFAQSRGSGATTTIVTAAQPDEPPHKPTGLDLFLEWLLEPDPHPPVVAMPRSERDDERSFWRIEEVA